MATNIIKELQLPGSNDTYVFNASYLGGTAASNFVLKSEIPEGAKIKTLNTTNTTSLTTSSSEAIGGEGSISLHKISKTGKYNDLLNKPDLSIYVNTDDFNYLDAKVTSITDSLSVIEGSIPTKVSQLTNDSGYTTNKGTVTSVAVKINGSVKGTITDSGTIDLGTFSTTDTKNTAGSTNSTSKLYIIGATSQAANPQTYSYAQTYIGTDGNLYSNGKKVALEENIPSLTNYVTTDTTQTITGIKTFNSPKLASGEQATTTFKTANGGQIIIGKEGPNSGTMLAFDQAAGTRRLNFRASSTPGAMIWSQPEANSTLYYDVKNIQFREVAGITFSNFKGGFLKTNSSGTLTVDTSTYSKTDTNYYHTSGSWSGLTYTAKANGGAGVLAFTIPTGTSGTTVALGNHTHSQYLTSHRTIQVNGTSIGNNTLNLKAGDNITLNNSSGTVTISAASGGTSVVITDLTTI